jgi:glycosyltransferase involved in cell wall biosynthesis
MLEASRALRRECLNGTDGPLVLFSGSLIERKAPDLLLDMFARDLAPRFANARLLFAGDGPLRASLEQATESAGLVDRVRFAGFLRGQQLWQAYLASDLFVLPSRGHEGWGVVVQEAMAAGLPVIVSDQVGAGVDLIRMGETGYVYSADSPSELSRILTMLCTDADLCRRVGQAAREAVVSTAAPAAVERFFEFFRKVIGHDVDAVVDQGLKADDVEGASIGDWR